MYKIGSFTEDREVEVNAENRSVLGSYRLLIRRFQTPCHPVASPET